MSIGHILGYTAELITRSSCSKIIDNIALCSMSGIIMHDLVVEPLVNSLIVINVSSIISSPRYFINRCKDLYNTVALRPKSFWPILKQNLSQIDRAELCTKVFGSIILGKIGERVFDNAVFSMFFSFIGAVIGEKVYNIGKKLDCKRYINEVYRKLSTISYVKLQSRFVSGMIFLDIADRLFAKNILATTAFALCGILIGSEFYRLTQKYEKPYSGEKRDPILIIMQKKLKRKTFSLQNHQIYKRKSEKAEITVGIN